MNGGWVEGSLNRLIFFKSDGFFISQKIEPHKKQGGYIPPLYTPFVIEGGGVRFRKKKCFHLVFSLNL